jgi:CYTH domain-containing protein
MCYVRNLWNGAMVVGIFVHHESDEAWAVVEYGGTLWEIDVPYDTSNIGIYVSECIDI